LFGDDISDIAKVDEEEQKVDIEKLKEELREETKEDLS